MAYQQKPGQGSLLPNKKPKQTNSPSMTGSAICPCCQNELDLAAWTKVMQQSGDKWLSLALKNKAQRPPQQSQRPTQDDDSPF